MTDEATTRTCWANKRREARCKQRTYSTLCRECSGVFTLHGNGRGYDFIAIEELASGKRVKVVRVDLDSRTFPVPKTPSCADVAEVWLYRRDRQPPVRIPVK